MMTKELKIKADKYYLFLGGLFIAALVVCNLIANKFVTVDLGFYVFTISAGVLPYPITFLVTDILSEIYGKKKTNRVVISGFIASAFILFVLWLGSQFNSIPDSPVSDEMYNTVFSNSWRVVTASMVAYLTAQFVDVKLYHFWKDLTKGKHLWLRNNGSTILSQFVDTLLVVTVLFFGTKNLAEMKDLVLDGWMFKILCAFVDTPLIYGATWLFRRKFNLKFAEEIDDDMEISH
jgi:queuosine precursor transporter